MLGYNALLHGEHGLDEARRAGCRFQMAYVGLDGADEQGSLGVAPVAVHRAHGVRLDSVAELRAGGVGFQVVDVRAAKSRLRERGLHHALLRGAVRHGKSRARAVLVDGGASNYAPDSIAVRFGVAEAA